jgi:hypothetical protein
MTKSELFATYALPIIAAVVTALAGFMGAQLKSLYQKYVNDKTKESVVRTCVKAVEQLYHDLGGPEKLEKAKEGIKDMLNEKGIPITELEMNLLIEAVVSEFNYGFAKAGEVPKSDTPAVEEKTPQNDSITLYSEEEGASL